MSTNTITMFGVDDIVIDPRWAKYLPEVEGDALDLLADSIQSEGIREPLTVTANKFELLDGHRRLAAAKQIGLKQVPTVSYHFADDAEKELFVVTTQLQRRNLTPERLSYMRGRRYNLLKRGDGGHGDQKSGGQIVTPIPAAEIVAKQSGVSARTVKRDAQFAAGVDKIEQAIGAEASKAILDGHSPITKATVAKAAKANTAAEVVAAVDDMSPKGIQARVTKKVEQVEFNRALQEIKRARALATRAMKVAKKAKAIYGGEWINTTVLSRAIRDFREQLDGFSPGGPCPRCNGTKCISCLHRGYVSKSCLARLASAKANDAADEIEVRQ